MTYDKTEKKTETMIKIADFWANSHAIMDVESFLCFDAII